MAKIINHTFKLNELRIVDGEPSIIESDVKCFFSLNLNAMKNFEDLTGKSFLKELQKFSKDQDFDIYTKIIACAYIEIRDGKPCNDMIAVNNFLNFNFSKTIVLELNFINKFVELIEDFFPKIDELKGGNTSKK